MGKNKPSAPAPVVVNPGATATGQAQFNKDAALQQRALNMVDQYTPQGTVTYEATGKEIEGIPQYKVTQSYSPEQQQLYDIGTGIQKQYADIGQSQLSQVGEKLSSPFNLDQFGVAPTVNEATRQATMDAMMGRLNPQFDRDRAALETQLANQGFVAGTAGYDTAIDELNRSRTDARLAADAQAGNEMARMYGLETSARDRAINEALMSRTQPLSELSTLMSGSQPSTGAFLPTPQGQISAPDFMGAQYGSANMANQAAQQRYAQQMGQSTAGLQGLYGLGAAGLGAAGYAWGK